MLLNLLNDSNAALRIAAAEALYYLGEADLAVEVLIESIQADNVMARVQALNVLQTLGSASLPAVEVARKLVASDSQSKEYDVRAARGFIKQMTQSEYGD